MNEDLHDLTLQELLRIGWARRKKQLEEEESTRLQCEEEETARRAEFIAALAKILPPALSEYLSYSTIIETDEAIYEIADLTLPDCAPIKICCFKYIQGNLCIVKPRELYDFRGITVLRYEAGKPDNYGIPQVNEVVDKYFDLEHLVEALSLASENHSKLDSVREEAIANAKAHKKREQPAQPTIVSDTDIVHMAEQGHGTLAIVYSLNWIVQELHSLNELHQIQIERIRDRTEVIDQLIKGE